MTRKNKNTPAQAYEKLKEAYAQLKDSYIELIFRLALMAESRDDITGTHLIRVSDYSCAIAAELGLDEADIEILRYASPMHDMGKIMLPDSVLKKKGPLTKQERTLVGGHPQTGYDIFKNAESPILRACGEIALSHHERFDGKGYPNGLKGSDIPIFGRIVALADCFDAYTSWRTYKAAFPFEEAVSMVMSEAGAHFDPKVVMAFKRAEKNIKRIYEANRDIERFLAETDGRSGRKRDV